jgi:hypothetical protein
MGYFRRPKLAFAGPYLDVRKKHGAFFRLKPLPELKDVVLLFRY